MSRRTAKRSATKLAFRCVFTSQTGNTRSSTGFMKPARTHVASSSTRAPSPTPQWRFSMHCRRLMASCWRCISPTSTSARRSGTIRTSPRVRMA
ncbi:UNVERIFIED_CONTAM: hypothetical protein GTU68_054707 [Idotea baltica]|nr:hypothetical protein [Idotea baltica]